MVRYRRIEQDCCAYVVWDENRDDAALIDAGVDPAVIVSALGGRSLAAILLTHGHFDHIKALASLRAPIHIHSSDAPKLTDIHQNLSTMIGRGFTVRAADKLLDGGETLELAGMKIGVIHTPGHTKGSMCFRVGSVLFSGDTLFQNGVGRTDFADGDAAALRRSLNSLFGLEGIRVVCPGHGEQTTLEAEKERYV